MVSVKVRVMCVRVRVRVRVSYIILVYVDGAMVVVYYGLRVECGRSLRCLLSLK
jgi:hypothetical protein